MNSRRLMVTVPAEDLAKHIRFLVRGTCFARQRNGYAHVRVGSEMAQHEPVARIEALCRNEGPGSADNRLTRRSKYVSSFDHIVSANQERLRDRQSERLGGLQVDDQLELGG